MVTVPQFIYSFFQKPKLNSKVDKFFEFKPEITLSEKILDGKNITEILIKNLRNARYLSDEWSGEVNWDNKKYKLGDLSDIDLFTDKYGFLQTHAILIFNFIDEFKVCKKLCVSYEVIKEQPKDFSVLQVVYKNFAGGYILGNFEDLIYVRFLRYSNFDHSKVPGIHKQINFQKSKIDGEIWTENFPTLNIHKLNFSKKECQEILQSLIKDVNYYAQQNKISKPPIYNFIYRNCLTNILKHFETTGRFFYHYYEILFLDKLLLKNKVIC